MSQAPQHHEAPEPPAMGERRARWGYGYQDKVVTDRILRILKDDLRGGAAVFEGVRLADLQAGRVDDFVLVWNRQVEGNSIKWSGDASPMNWGDLIGANGLVKELPQGFLALRQRWPDRTVTVRLQTNRPPSLETHANHADRESLASRHELTYQGYIRGDAQEGNQLIVWNSERQLVGPQYRWVAMNSNVARELGWTLCPTNPFEWQDSAGHSTVKSEYWKDGWIWLEPPRFEALGEGWYVLASDLAVEAIRRAFPDAQTHLWVERHSHGAEPYERSWHLRQPF